MKKDLLVPDFDRENQKRLEEILKEGCPELYYLYQALNQTGIEPALVIEFVFQLKNVLDNGWGKVWVDVAEGKAIFVQAMRKVKVAQNES